MPPLRLAILDDVAHASAVADAATCAGGLSKPRATVDRQLQALHMLGVLVCDEEEGWHQGKPVSRWHYRLARGISPGVLNPKRRDKSQCQKSR